MRNRHASDVLHVGLMPAAKPQYEKPEHKDLAFWSDAEQCNAVPNLVRFKTGPPNHSPS